MFVRIVEVPTIDRREHPMVPICNREDLARFAADVLSYRFPALAVDCPGLDKEPKTFTDANAAAQCFFASCMGPGLARIHGVDTDGQRILLGIGGGGTAKKVLFGSEDIPVQEEPEAPQPNRDVLMLEILFSNLCKPGGEWTPVAEDTIGTRSRAAENLLGAMLDQAGVSDLVGWSFAKDSEGRKLYTCHIRRFD